MVKVKCRVVSRRGFTKRIQTVYLNKSILKITISRKDLWQKNANFGRNGFSRHWIIERCNATGWFKRLGQCRGRDMKRGCNSGGAKSPFALNRMSYSVGHMYEITLGHFEDIPSRLFAQVG